MYDNIDTDEKIKYLCEIDYYIIPREEIVNYIFDNADIFKGDNRFKNVLKDLKAYGDDIAYYKIDLDGYPSNLYEDEIDTMFDEEIEKIIKDTSFLKDYPQYDNNNNLKR